MRGICIFIGIVRSALHPSADGHAFNPSKWAFVKAFQTSLFTFGTGHPGLVTLDATIPTGIARTIDCWIHREARWRFKVVAKYTVGSGEGGPLLTNSSEQ